MFYPKDALIYNEARDVVPAALVTKGQSQIRENVFGFYFFSTLAIGDEVTFVYKMRQVLSDKRTGTGEAIVSGDRLYYYPATDDVSPVAIGVLGTDYYFCGWAKENAGADVETVLMNFDGTQYDHIYP